MTTPNRSNVVGLRAVMRSSSRILGFDQRTDAADGPLRPSTDGFHCRGAARQSCRLCIVPHFDHVSDRVAGLFGLSLYLP